MSATVKNQLRRLIKSMTKSEKRNFKLFAQRAGSKAESKFIQLFDLIDAQSEANDVELAQQVANGKPGNLSNIKRHLYQQLLISLRLLHINKQTDIEIRQQIDFARILYGKGHYLDALRLLERIKVRAQDNNYDILLLEILEFQKMIEARHVTRSRQMNNKMDQLVRDSIERSEINLHTSLQTNINIQIQGYYILHGHAKEASQLAAFDEFWRTVRDRAEGYPPAVPTFFERINRFQASMWRYYIKLDFENALDAALSCYNLFRLESEMPLHDPDLFLRMLYYVNAYAFLTGKTKELERSTRNIHHFIKSEGRNFNDNSRLISFIYQQLSLLNLYINQQNWEEAHKQSLSIQGNQEMYKRLPNHRLNLFRYKFAGIAFASGQYDEAIDYLQLIMNAPLNQLREDLLINTRLLLAICYFEVNDYYLADYVMTNLRRMIRKNKFAGQLHLLTINTLRQLMREPKAQWKVTLSHFADEIAALQSAPYEQKLLKFVDVQYWARLRM